MFLYLFTHSKDFFIESLTVFSIAAFTDYLDGFLARKLNTVSKFGEQLDPICDKVLTLSAFVAFAMNSIVPVWCVAIVGIRDVANTLLRYLFLSKKNIPTSKFAKAKTVLQFVFILFILLLQAFSESGTNPTTNAVLHSVYIDSAMIVITVITL